MGRLFFSVLLSSLLFACTSQDIKIDVKQSQSHYQLGLEFAQLSLFKNALEEFDLAIKFNPEDAKIYRKKGILLFGMKKYEEAKIQEAKHTPSIQILDPAVIPIKKYRPRRLLLVMTTSLISLIMIILYFVSVENYSRNNRSEERV